MKQAIFDYLCSLVVNGYIVPMMTVIAVIIVLLLMILWDDNKNKKQQQQENINKEKYEIEYEEFWKDIVENKDGTLNKEQIIKELYDYSMIMDNCARAYCAMTKQRISKQNTMFFEVENIFNELFLDNDIVVDDMIEILKTDDINELKQTIKDYFNIIEN